MKVITKTKELENIFITLLDKYSKCKIATAWASLGTSASRIILKNNEKIEKMIVGLHFYQTHPEFIKEFMNFNSVRFILDTSGIYHPKVYLFYNDKYNWECLIGSANLTIGGFSSNTEVMLQISNEDRDCDVVFNDLVDCMEGYWNRSEKMTEEYLSNYTRIWANMKKKVDVLKNQYGQKKTKKDLIKSDLFSYSWEDYFKRIKNDKTHSYDGRLKLLEKAQIYFEKKKHFSNMELIVRKEIAGTITKNQRRSDIDWGWFGSMYGAGKFKNRINENDQYLSQALDVIPLNGEVSRSEYNKFIELYIKAFPDGRDGIATASRLLAMKRPDIFVCLDEQNKRKLCEEFGIALSVNYESYWYDIIMRIQESVWWSSEKPTIAKELKAWKVRAAMLDVIYYIEK
jgi:HKD family nuclease